MALLLAAFSVAPPVASAEDDNGPPIQYEVIEEPEPANPPPPPSQYGQPQQQPQQQPQPQQPPQQQPQPQVTTQPVYGQPVSTQGVVVVPPVNGGPPPPPPGPPGPLPGSYRTGISGGLFFSYSPQGRFAHFDSTSSVVTISDFPATVGLGGQLLGIGRHVGGGVQARLAWALNLASGTSWTMTDIHGLLRARGRWGMFEFYGQAGGGFSVQRFSYSSSSAGGYTDASGGMSFGAALGFKFFLNDTIALFFQPGMVWRLFFRDVTSSGSNSLGIRQFTLDFGVNFGA